MPDRLGYAILFVENLEASVSIYRDTLGVPFGFSHETHAEFATEGTKFVAWRCRRRAPAGYPVCMGASRQVDNLEATLRKVVPALRDVDVPFLLAGSAACYAYGGPPPEKDLDLIVKPEDAHRAQDALASAGLRPERPPEEWLLKAWSDDVLVDLIFSPKGLEVTDEMFDRAIHFSVAAMDVPVMSLEDLFTSKLLAVDEHHADYSVLLVMARAVREQVDWGEVRERTRQSPMAAAFFTLIEELGLVHPVHPERRVHVTAIGEEGPRASS